MYEIGLVDELIDDARIRPAALEFAASIASAAPLAVAAVRATLRRGLAYRVRAATAVEAGEQDRPRRTEDFQEVSPRAGSVEPLIFKAGDANRTSRFSSRDRRSVFPPAHRWCPRKYEAAAAR